MIMMYCCNNKYSASPADHPQQNNVMNEQGLRQHYHCIVDGGWSSNQGGTDYNRQFQMRWKEVYKYLFTQKGKSKVHG